MKKMASMQVYMASDPASRQALDRQMVTWDENLEKLHIEQYQLRCYLAAMQGADLPSTKVSQIHLLTADRLSKLLFCVYFYLNILVYCVWSTPPKVYEDIKLEVEPTGQRGPMTTGSDRNGLDIEKKLGCQYQIAPKKFKKK